MTRWSAAARGTPIMPAFPSYTRGEIAADRVVHGAGVFGALAATTWLFATLGPVVSAGQAVTLAIYCFGLVAMLGASAAYGLAPPGRMKARLRQIDRAMVFVMIAGSYTPFAVGALEPEIGLPLCATVWGLACLGVGLKLGRVECRERTWIALYLAMGWLLLAVLPWFVAALPGPVLALLLGGGVVYTLGSLVHASAAVRFHNVLWHAMVLVAASLHFVAVIRMIGAAT
jgi:hemolysin III